MHTSFITISLYSRGFGVFFFQAEDGIRDFCLSRGLGDVYKRQAMYLAREMMGLSLTRIGDAFGGRHYTTVMSSISKVEDSIKQSPSLVSLLDDIRRMIKNPT